MKPLALLPLLAASAAARPSSSESGLGGLPFRGLRARNNGRFPWLPAKAKHRHWLNGFSTDDAFGEEDAGEEGSKGAATSGSTNATKAQVFTQLVDHFPDEAEYAPHPANGTSWQQKWWFDATYWKKGGPVIFFDPGEGPGDASYVTQQFMTGALAKALSGVIVELEHRYFGSSFPVDDLSTDNLRFLTVRQAMADSAYFAMNVEIPGVSEDLSSPGTPWISYGGSYPGAKSAFTRLTYPTIFYGAIASSAVTHPTTDMWTYYDVVRRYLEPTCSALLVTHANIIDQLWGLNQPAVDEQVTGAFGLGYQQVDKVGFSLAISNFYGYWQDDGQSGITDNQWDPKNGHFGNTLDTICSNVSNPTIPKAQASSYLNSTLVGPLTTILKNPDPTVSAAWQAAGTTYDSSASDDMVDDLMASFVAFADLVGGVLQSECDGSDLATCFSTAPPPQKELIQISQSSSDRDWEWLVCNEFGFQDTAAGTNTPTLVSRQLTSDNLYKVVCSNNFPAGEHYSIQNPSNISDILAFGDFNITSSRLIEIGGEYDPWRPVSPLADGNAVANTSDSPAYTIPYAGHCFDFQYPSAGTVWKAPLQPVYDLYVSTLKSWLSSWSAPQASSAGETSMKTASGASISWTPATPAEAQLIGVPMADGTMSNKSTSDSSDDGSTPWYKNDKVWIGVGVGAAALAGVAGALFYFMRRRGSQGRSYFPVGHQAPQLETSMASGTGGFYRDNPRGGGGYGALGGGQDPGFTPSQHGNGRGYSAA